MRVAQAKLEICDKEVVKETLGLSSDCDKIKEEYDTPQVNLKKKQGVSQNLAQADLNITTSQSVSGMPVSASVIQDSLAMS